MAENAITEFWYGYSIYGGYLLEYEVVKNARIDTIPLRKAKKYKPMHIEQVKAIIDSISKKADAEEVPPTPEYFENGNRIPNFSYRPLRYIRQSEWFMQFGRTYLIEILRPQRKAVIIPVQKTLVQVH